MPHLTVEYSRNIEQDVAPRDLLARLHATMVATPEFPLGGIRVRAAPRDLYIVADGDPDNAFVDAGRCHGGVFRETRPVALR